MEISRRQSLATMGATLAVTGFHPARAAETRPKIRLVALDVGGTIIEDHGEVPAALQAAFKARGITVESKEIAEWRGASKREMVRHFVELRTKPGANRGVLTDAIYKNFNEIANEAYSKVRPIPGAESAIAELKRQGYLIATTTGFGRELNDFIMRRLGWHELFTATITSDDVADGRPAPYMLFHAIETARIGDVAEVVAVGDTPLDLEAAHNGGLRASIGVLTGAGAREAMERAPHTKIVPSITDVPALMREI